MDIDATFTEKLSALESKLEKVLTQGISLQPGMSSSILGGASTLSTEQKQQDVPQKLPEAVPQEVLQLPKAWQEILRELNPAARMLFSSVVPGVIEGDVLYLVHGKGLEKGTTQYIDEIKKAIAKVCGKDVRLQPILDVEYTKKTQVLYAGGVGEKEVVKAIGETITLLKSKIHFPVTEE
jgi:hypothetical protein